MDREMNKEAHPDTNACQHVVHQDIVHMVLPDEVAHERHILL